MYDITEACVSWLDGMGLAASTYPPSDASTFVTVERTGGGMADMIDHPVMAFQFWAPTEAAALALANSVRVAMDTGPWPEGVTNMRRNSGPYRWYDEATRLPRYQTLVDVTCIIDE